MDKMKEYQRVKLSRSPYLESIPEHWFEYRLSQIAQNSVVRYKENEVLLSVYLNHGVMKYADTVKTQVHKPSEDLSNYKFVEVGNLVLNNQQAWRGSVGVSQYRGLVSPVYYVLKLSSIFNHRFANYLFRNHSMVDQYVPSSKGVGSIQRNLYYPYLKNIIVNFPPKEEQDQIVRYLDSKLVKINKFIRNKKRLIELLKEQKQAIIKQAVTRGLDPDVKMKPSGVEWLGDVPAGWEVKPLKYLAKINNGRDFNYDEAGGVPVYGSGGMFSKTNKVMHKGPSVLLGRKGTIDKPILVKEPFWSVDTAFYTEIKVNVNYEFFYYTCCNIDFNLYVHGTALPSMTQTILNSIKRPLPLLTEQIEIVKYIKKKTQTIDQAIDRIKKEIDLITEYRTSLISAVVTGKVDVRGIAVEEPPAEGLEALEPAELEADELQEEELFESGVG